MNPVPNNPGFDLTINQRTPCHVPSGTTLLTALNKQGIFIPSACGGHGACGLCKVRLDRDAAPELTPKEIWHLTEDERRSGMRLACQVPVRQNLAVTIPESFLSASEYQAEVSAIRDLTHDIRELELRLLQPPALTFKAGQYIQFQIPRYEQVKQVSFRPYSIASAPSRADRIELEIRYMPHGLGTTYIFKHLKPHDPVKFHGPHGDFCLRDSSRDVLLIAGGSGMAPMKSILEDMRKKQDRRTTRFYFGAVSRRDLFLTGAMQQLETDLPDFKFIPALSQPVPADAWNGETGLITEVIEQHIRPGQPADAYLCGSPGMIDACLEVLKRKGIPGDHIFYDKFTKSTPGGT